MDNYEDIINLPHFRSQKHPHMSVHDRAAQFAPFAALTGYGDAVEEARRITDRRPELDENRLAELDFILADLAESSSNPSISVTYFKPDEKKEGGEYVTFSGCLAKIDSYARKLVFSDGREVSISDIVAIDT